MLCDGDAAVFLDSSIHLQAYIDKARLNSTIDDDLHTVEAQLRQRFPARMADDDLAAPYAELRDLKQQPGEPLAAYYSRTNNLLVRMGCRDVERPSPSARVHQSLSPLELSMLSSVVEKFVYGLDKQELRQEAIDKGALNSPSLWHAYDTIRNSQRVLDQKAVMRAEAHGRARTSMMEQLLAQQMGVNADVALAQHFPGYAPLPPTQTTVVAPNFQPLNDWSTFRTAIPNGHLAGIRPMSGPAFGPGPFTQTGKPTLTPQPVQPSQPTQAQQRLPVRQAVPPATQAQQSGVRFDDPYFQTNPNKPLPPRSSSQNPFVNQS